MLLLSKLDFLTVGELRDEAEQGNMGAVARLAQLGLWDCWESAD